MYKEKNYKISLHNLNHPLLKKKKEVIFENFSKKGIDSEFSHKKGGIGKVGGLS